MPIVYNECVRYAQKIVDIKEYAIVEVEIIAYLKTNGMQWNGSTKNYKLLDRIIRDAYRSAGQ